MKLSRGNGGGGRNGSAFRRVGVLAWDKECRFGQMGAAGEIVSEGRRFGRKRVRSLFISVDSYFSPLSRAA